MTIDFDPNKIPSREEREERVLDLHFNQNKNYRQIAKEMKISVRDIGAIVNRAREEKERQEHKSIAVQAYEHFSKGKTPLQVAIILNIGQTEVTHYYTQYLTLVGLNDITKIYLEFKGDTWYLVNLCKAAKAAKMGVLQVVNLLRIANNNLPSVEHRYQELQKQANALGKLGRNLEAIQYYQRAIKLIQSNQSSNVSAIYYHTTPKARSLYIFVSEDQGSSIQFIQAASSEDNGQNQKITLIKLNLADQYKSIKEFKLAIVTYTEILHYDPYNGCALLGRADALMKSGQPDQAAKDEKIGDMLKPTCSTGGTNIQKPPKPSQPDLVVTLAGALFH
jgi:tetratricopeptide (TPR) repeat protein